MSTLFEAARVCEGAEQAAGRHARALTVVIGPDASDPDLRASVAAIRDALGGVDAQVIVATEAPWPEAPEGVDVVAYPSAGKGDRYDAAARAADGELLAFLDSHLVVGPSWAGAVLRLFEDPEVVLAGGPIVLAGRRLGERVGGLIVSAGLGSTPASHSSADGPRKDVREVAASNLVVRADAFRRVGGFQTPVRGGSEAPRICYKVRNFHGGRVVLDPALALEAAAPAFPGRLLREVAQFGRFRGDLSRRLPEAAPLLPYALPSLCLVVLAALLATGLAAPAPVGTAALLVAAAGALATTAYLSARFRRAGEPWRTRVLAAAALPLVLAAFGASFAAGYLGRGLGDISPPRERARGLRVLILNWRDVTHPASGGAETYMHQIARRWVSQGIEVGWLTARHAGSSKDDTIDGIRIYRVGGAATLYARAALHYLRHLRGRYDVVVDCENGVPFFSPLYCRVPKVLVVHHVHQEIFRTQLPRWASWLALWLEGSLMPRVYRKVRVVAVSEGTRGDLVELGFAAGSIEVIRNGVVPPAAPVSSRPEQPAILCMGRLKAQKSVDVLIRALPAVVAALPGTQLDIVGQGPERQRLERLAWTLGLAGHVRFHGYVRSEVRDSLSAAAWVAVCPSSFEGWGVVCMEASARGLPVVASDVPGLRESVRHGETGLLFPYGDVEALSRTLVELLPDAPRRQAMGEAGTRWAAAHTWDRSAAEFARLLVGEVAAATTTPPVIDLTAEAPAEPALVDAG